MCIKRTKIWVFFPTYLKYFLFIFGFKVGNRRVEWLGRILIHWNRVRYQYIFRTIISYKNLFCPFTCFRIQPEQGRQAVTEHGLTVQYAALPFYSCVESWNKWKKTAELKMGIVLTQIWIRIFIFMPSFNFIILRPAEVWPKHCGTVRPPQ